MTKGDSVKCLSHSGISFSSSSSASPPAWTAPGWAALYTISSNDIYNQPSYTTLRSNRSPREAELLSRVSILDRRIYKLLSDTDSSSDSLRARKADESEKEAKVIVATSVTLVDEEAQTAYDEWYEKEHVPLLQKVPGWKRTRRFLLVDALINGKQAEKDNADGKKVPVCLGLHGELQQAKRFLALC